MNALFKFSILLIIINFIINISCNSSITNPEKRISNEIANESCSFISEITSSFVVGAISGAVNELTNSNSNLDSDGSINLIPGYWCECYTYYISIDLMNQFTFEELREIKYDNLKKIMVLSKLLQLHKDEIKECIELTLQDKIRNYTDFERKLNRKLKINLEH